MMSSVALESNQHDENRLGSTTTSKPALPFLAQTGPLHTLHLTPLPKYTKFLQTLNYAHRKEDSYISITTKKLGTEL